MSTISSRFGVSFLNHPAQSRFRALLIGEAKAGNGWIETFIQRSRQRRQLMEIDDSQLLDMGISRAEAEREARKPFWRA